MNKDRRKSERIKLPNVALAMISGNKIEAIIDGGILFGKIYNISDSGVSVKLDKPLKTGDSINIRIRISKTDLDFTANIIHSHSNGNDSSFVGLEFDWEKTPKENKTILKFHLENQ